MTGKYVGPAHQICNIIVTQKQTTFILLAIQILNNYEFHLFFKRLLVKRNAKVNNEIIPKTNVEYSWVTYGCTRFIDSYRFLSMGLDDLVKTLHNVDFEILKKEFSDE